MPDIPPPNPSSRLLEWKVLIQQWLNANPPAPVVIEASCRLREFLSVDPETLDPLPAMINGRIDPETEAQQYASEQRKRWIDSKQTLFVNPAAMQTIELPDFETARGILEQLCGETQTTTLGRWVLDYFGGVASLEERENCRRLVAAKMERLMNPIPPPHTSLKTAQDRLQPDSGFGRNYELHLRSVFLPFLQSVKNDRNQS